MIHKPARQFHEIQALERRKSLLILGFLVLFYFAAICLVLVIIAAGFGLFSFKPFSFSVEWPKIFLASAAAASGIAIFHYYDARHNGAAFIRSRLGAQVPEQEDRYHKRFSNTVEEMRLGCGLPRVMPYVLPDFAINSLALIERDGSPSVLVTEGLLADFTRDELQAVIAHELAHILRGDSFHITLVCSLANFFERLRLAMEPDRSPQGVNEGGGPPLLYAAVTLSAVVMHLLSTLISRQREMLADATAVEISRSPRSLARAIYRAHVKNSFVGDFNLTYSPLFIVPPGSRDIPEGFFGRLFNSHPPLHLRLKTLAAMEHITPAAIVDEVREIQRRRESARDIPAERRWQESDYKDPRTDRVWLAKTGDGRWEGPVTLSEALGAPFFSSRIRMAHLQEGVEASAAEFPQIRKNIRSSQEKKREAAETKEICPHCRIPLRKDFYEGIPLLLCSRCGGKYVDAGAMPKIISRKEVGFTEAQIRKAREFRDRSQRNPVKGQRIFSRQGRLNCPDCGGKLLPRPYNYQYFIPVDKCLACDKIWFDADELEILQILIEKLDQRTGSSD